MHPIAMQYSYFLVNTKIMNVKRAAIASSTRVKCHYKISFLKKVKISHVKQQFYGCEPGLHASSCANPVMPS